MTNDEVRELRALIDQRFDVVDQRFDVVDQRFHAVDQRFDAVDQRFDAVDRRFDAVDRRLESVVQRLDGHDARFVGLDRTVTAIALRFDRLDRVIYEGFTAVDRRFGDMTGHFDRVYGWLEKLEQERIVSNELMKRLERWQEEATAALSVLPRVSDTLARLTEHVERLTERVEHVTDQQAAMAATLGRLEARG